MARKHLSEEIPTIWRVTKTDFMKQFIINYMAVRAGTSYETYMHGPSWDLATYKEAEEVADSAWLEYQELDEREQG